MYLSGAARPDGIAGGGVGIGEGAINDELHRYPIIATGFLSELKFGSTVAGWLRVTAAAISFPGGVERSRTQKPWRPGRNAFTWKSIHIPKTWPHFMISAWRRPIVLLGCHCARLGTSRAGRNCSIYEVSGALAKRAPHPEQE